MAQKQISQLNAKSSAAVSDQIPVDDSLGATWKLTLGQVVTLVNANITGALQVANNLSDVANAATARTNLGVPSLTGTGVSGTWAINISGSAATATSATSATSATTAAGLSATLGIATGGTGQVTALAAFNALSPLTTKGDLIVFDGTNNNRLPVNTNGYVLTLDSAQTLGIKWAAAGVGDMLLGTAQTITAAKTFNDATCVLAGLTSGTVTLKAAAVAGTNTQTHQAITGTIYCTGGQKVAIADGGTNAATAQAAINALSPLTTIGDILVYDGTNTTRLAAPATGQVLTGNGVGVLPSYQAAAGGIVAQRVSVLTGTVASGSTAGPTVNNTIPINTAGTQFLTLTITPKSAANILVIDIWTSLSDSATQNPVMMLFQDTTANALAVTIDRTSTTNVNSTMMIRHIMTAGTTSATTFKMRAGDAGANTITFNGSSGTQLFGGVYNSGMMITEYTQ